MPYVKNASVEIYYETSGLGDPLVLVMGLGADHQAWQLHRAAYERYFTCISIDNRGVGRSGKPHGPYTTSEMARDVLAVMDDLQVPTAHVAGISMGGAIAQQVSLIAPMRVKSLALIATFARLPAFHAAVFGHFKAVRQHVSPDVFLSCLQLWIWSEQHFAMARGELVEKQREAFFDTSPQPGYAFDAQCDACISHDTFRSLGAIEVPTLITAGARDIFTPLSLAEELHGAIAGSRLEVFAESAHTHHWEQLSRFNDLTIAFFQGK